MVQVVYNARQVLREILFKMTKIGVSHSEDRLLVLGAR